MNDDHDIRTLLDEVSSLIDAAFAAVNYKPAAGSALDQAGLTNGKEIVEDYLRHGEPVVAFEHLLYMIEEPGLTLSAEGSALLEKIRAALGR